MNLRNMRISLRDSCFEFQDFIYWTYLYRMCDLILIEKLPYRHVYNLLEKNFSLYLLIEVWLVINLVIYIHNELKRPKCFSQAPSLELVKWIGWLLLLFKLRKCFSLKSDTWKYICYFLTILLHSSFLLNSHDIFLDRTEFIL